MADKAANTPAKRASRARKAVAPPPPVAVTESDPMLTALSASTEALQAVTGATERLIVSLDQTDRTNKDTRRWRRVATIAFVSACALLLALIAQTRLESQHRSQNDRKAAAVAAAVAEVHRIETCQNRNYSQQYTRNANTTQNNAVISLGIPQEAVDSLRHSEAVAPPDSDCDRDGVLTTADYPPAPVPSN